MFLPSDNTEKRFFTAGIRWTVAIACVIYIVIILGRNQNALRSIAHINFASIIFMAALYAIYYLLYGIRFRIILWKCTQKTIPHIKNLILLVNGMLLNSLLPQMGNAYRGLRMKKEHQIPYTGYITTYGFFIWLDMCLNLFLSFVLMVGAKTTVDIGGFSGRLIVISMFLALISAPLIARFLFKTFTPKWQPLFKIWSKVTGVLDVMVYSIRDWKSLLRIVGLSLMLFVNLIPILYLGFQQLGHALPVSTIAIFCVLYKISVYVVLTPGNIGIRELAYGVLCKEVGIGMAEGVLAGTMLRVISYFVLLILAGCLYFIQPNRSDCIQPPNL